MTDITLDVYKDSSESERIGRHYLYFGNKFLSQFQGWDWVRSKGMKVDPPWALDSNTKLGSIVTRQQLIEWIIEGNLSISCSGNDTSTEFLNKYHSWVTFRLSFLDWS